MRKRIDVLPNNWGLIYRDNALVTVAEPGVYWHWDFTRRLSYLLVPKTPRVVQVSNQEVLTKDNIAFRFSFSAEYRFVDPRLVAQNVDFTVVGLNSPKALIELFEWRIRLALQEHYRQLLASVSAEEVDGNQGANLAELPEAMVLPFLRRFRTSSPSNWRPRFGRRPTWRTLEHRSLLPGR